MKKVFFTALMTIRIFACHAEIREVSDMEEVFAVINDADTQTLVDF